MKHLGDLVLVQRSVVAAAVLASAFTLAGVVRAQAPAESQAERAAAYQKARDAMTAKDWEGAHRIFADLWSKNHTYDVALGLGQVELNLKRYRDAAEHIAYGLRHMPAKEKPELEGKAKYGFEVARQQVCTVHLTVDRAGADVLVDGQSIGTWPLEGDQYVEPGTHTLEARIADHAPARQTMDAKAGQAQNVALNFTGPTLLPTIEPAAPAANPQPAPTASQEPLSASPPTSSNAKAARENYVPALVAGSLAVVAVGFGVGFSLDAASAKSDADKKRDVLASQFGGNACGAGASGAATECASLQKLQDRRSGSQTVATISFMAGGVFAASAVAAYFIWGRPQTEHAALGGWYVPGSGGLRLQGSF